MKVIPAATPMKASLLLFPSLVILGACKTFQNTTTPRTTIPDEALLVEASATEQGRISEARQAHDKAKDEYAAAQSDYRKVQDIRSNVYHERQMARDSVGRAEASVKKAAESSTSDDINAAKVALQKAKDELTIKDATLVVRDRQVAYGSAVVDAAKEHVNVAEARVNLAKVRAINTLDRPLVQKPDTSVFEERERRAVADEKVARTKLEAAEKEVAIASARLKELETGKQD